MGVGDEILAAGQAERYFHERGRAVAILDRKGWPRWHPIWEGNPAIVPPDRVRSGTPGITNCGGARPYIIYPFNAETGWTFNPEFQAREHLAKIYLTDAERRLGTHTRGTGPFILIEQYSKHLNLRWPPKHWEALVTMLHEDGFRVVQHTHPDTDFIVPGAEPVATTTFREACGILNSASLYIRGESGMCHAAAALAVPQATIWGGCMDWHVLGNYPLQWGIGVSEPCCGSYLPCSHCLDVMSSITPMQVLVAVRHQIGTYGLR